MHARIRAQLSEFMDGGLPPREHARIADHLATCANCRAELEALRRTVVTLRLLEAEEPPPGLADRIAARVQARKRFWWEGLWRPVAHFLDGPWGAPVATAAAGSAFVLVLQASLAGPTQRPAAVGVAEIARPLPPVSPTPQMPLAALRERQQLERRVGGVPALCLERPSTPVCNSFHTYMVGLALRDAPLFASQLEELPSRARERWLGEFSRFAAHSGSAPLIAERLRASGDPRAAELAPRFELVVAKPR